MPTNSTLACSHARTRDTIDQFRNRRNAAAELHFKQILTLNGKILNSSKGIYSAVQPSRVGTPGLLCTTNTNKMLNLPMQLYSTL